MHLFICIRTAFKSGGEITCPENCPSFSKCLPCHCTPSPTPPSPKNTSWQHLRCSFAIRFQRTLRQEKHTNTFQMVNNHTTYIFLPRAKLLPLILLFSRRTLHFHAVSVVVTLREAFVAFTECRNTFNGLFMLLCLVSFRDI